MSEPTLDFPQDDLPNEKISKKDFPSQKPRSPRGKSFLGKILFFIVIFGLIAAGFIIVQQVLFDLEAQAQIYAVQTAEAIASPGIMNSTLIPSTLESFPSTEISPTTDLTTTPLPAIATFTPNPDLIHTATIAAQLTQAAN